MSTRDTSVATWSSPCRRPRTVFPSTKPVNLKRSVRLQTRYDEAPWCPPGVDQLFCREAGPRMQVGEVTRHGAWPDAQVLGGILNGASSGDERCEHVHRALSRGRSSEPRRYPCPMRDASQSQRVAGNCSTRDKMTMMIGVNMIAAISGRWTDGFGPPAHARTGDP